MPSEKGKIRSDFALQRIKFMCAQKMRCVCVCDIACFVPKQKEPQSHSEREMNNAQDSLSCFYTCSYLAAKSNKLFARSSPFVCDDKLEDICFLLLPAQQRARLFISPFCFLSAAQHLICLRARARRSVQNSFFFSLFTYYHCCYAPLGFNNAAGER